MRLGNTAAAPFLGSQFASLHLGAVRVPTVPGKPVIDTALLSGGATSVVFLPSTNNGGSAVLSYIFYIEDLPVTPNVLFDGGVSIEATFSAVAEGDSVEVSAVNAVGEGPKSDSVTVT